MIFNKTHYHSLKKIALSFVVADLSKTHNYSSTLCKIINKKKDNKKLTNGHTSTKNYEIKQPNIMVNYINKVD
jgi:hypothetical protein